MLELLGNERGAADEEAVDVGLGEELGGVVGLDGAAVDNASGSGDGSAALRDKGVEQKQK